VLFELLAEVSRRDPDLKLLLADVLNTHKSFMVDHRYDPYEIYGTDQFMEELKGVFLERK